MLDKRQRQMTPEEFYAWQEPMDEKYELVGGYPVKMMTGASRRHNRIVWNLINATGRQLGNGPCEGFTSDTAVRTLASTRRRPDVGIECGERDDQSHEGADVRFVAEVLSPSTREFDMFGKVEEYRSIPGMRYVLLDEPNAPLAILWTRADDGSWSQVTLEGLQATFEMPAVDVRLSLADMYGNLPFHPSPRLVQGEEP